MKTNTLSSQDEYWLEHVFTVYNNFMMCTLLASGIPAEEIKEKLAYSTKQMNKLKNKCKRIAGEDNEENESL